MVSRFGDALSCDDHATRAPKFPMTQPKLLHEELIAELKSLSLYWRELSAGKDDEEIARVLARLKTDRKTIKGIFNYKIFGPA